jgi:hypothetical protein
VTFLLTVELFLGFDFAKAKSNLLISGWLNYLFPGDDPLAAVPAGSFSLDTPHPLLRPLHFEVSTPALAAFKARRWLYFRRFTHTATLARLKSADV